MGKFFNRGPPKGRPLPVTDKMKQKLAEKTLTNKINKLADWLEQQKDWNLFDGYVVMNFIIKQSLEPQMGKPGILKANQALEAIFIQETLEEAKTDGTKQKRPGTKRRTTNKASEKSQRRKKDACKQNKTKRK